MTDYQQFATGFIAECTARGLTVDEMKKVADDVIAKVKTAGIGDMLGSVAGATANVAKIPLLLAAVAPPLLGAAVGHGFAKATDIDPKSEVEDIHHDERMQAYQTETDRLTNLAKLQKVARKIPRPAALHS